MASRGIVSIIYKSLVVWQYLNIPTGGFWERELNTDWLGHCLGELFWYLKKPSSPNDYKLIYKAYATPCLLFIM